MRYVALPDAKPDKSTYTERGLIESGLPHLKLRWRSTHWRVYEVLLPAPFVLPERAANMTLEQLGSDRLLLPVIRPGAALVRVRWTPHWSRTRAASSVPGNGRASTRPSAGSSS